VRAVTSQQIQRERALPVLLGKVTLAAEVVTAQSIRSVPVVAEVAERGLLDKT
jgi:hypothetical protein